MHVFNQAIVFALISSAAGKTIQVAVTGYYNGIDTIGGSGMS